MFVPLVLSIALLLPDQQPPAKPVPKAKAAKVITVYAEGYKEALKTGKPLLVWVGQPAKSVPSAINVEVKELEDAKPPCLVIFKASGPKLVRLADLAGTPQADSINKVLYSKTAKATGGCRPPTLPTLAVQSMIGDQNAVMALVPLDKVTDEALGGNWSDPASWKSGKLPAAGANILIPAGITEVYDLASSPAYNTIRVDGTLSFGKAASTALLVQTIVNMPTGDVEIVEPNPAVTATITFADPGPLDLVNDPKELGRGYLAVGIMNPDGTMGAMATTNIQGAQKDGWKSISGIAKGAGSIDLKTLPTGWQVGDTLLFAGTGGSNLDETRSITGIAGSVVSFAPLSFDHLPPTAGPPIARFPTALTSAKPQQIGQSQAAQTERADPKEIPPADAIAKPAFGAPKRQHD